MPVKLPQHLSRAALLAIVAGVQGRMYLDMNAEGREYWNPDKGWEGADICMEIQDLLNQHGLVPGDEEQYVLPPAGDAGEQLIICLDGGFVRDVYSSLPTLHVVIVDWDVADTIIDWSELQEDPKLLTVETPHGELHVAVREADVTPISDAIGTDLEAVIIAAKDGDFLSADVPLRVPTTTDDPENSRASLLAEATARGVSCEDLDEAVHDAVGDLAANLNNAGLQAQIEFLVQRLGAAETRQLLRTCASDRP